MRYTLLILILFGILAYYVQGSIPQCNGISTRIGRTLVNPCGVNSSEITSNSGDRFGRIIVK